MIKRQLFTYLVLHWMVIAHAGESCPVIPLPVYAEKAASHFVLAKQVSIKADDSGIQLLAHYLQRELLRTAGITLPIEVAGGRAGIVLKQDKKLAGNAYSITMTPERITISGGGNEGLFYGIQSLKQLIDVQENKAGQVTLPCWTIRDQPVYSWRGLMLDESRHFFGKEKVKELLDWMAYYKLNKFHWHLTDQPGWRLEIKKYPLLSLVGGIGSQSDPHAAASFYSQEDVKEIVAYAAERFITVIPEIDMPGHATAANRAYPEYSGGGSRRFPEFTFNPGKEATYQFLSDILREVDALFPSQMIHLGGDEVHYGNENWHTNPDVQQLMTRERLNTLTEVEHYFMERMADSVYRLNNKLLAWDEIAGMDLPPSETIVFWWRHDKPEQLAKALDKGFNVVLCPRLPFYFDYLQQPNHIHGPKWQRTKVNTVKDVYSFTADSIIKAGQHKQILGVQANIWTESIRSEDRLEFMLFPRIAALAEAAWTKGTENGYPHFEERLKQHLGLYKAVGIYYDDVFNPGVYTEPVR